MKNLRLFLHTTLCALIMMAASTAKAQETTGEHRVLMMGGWELNEMLHSDGSFMGYWAIPLQQLSVGNIRRMWFEPIAGDDWAVTAHEPVNAPAFHQHLIDNGLSEESAGIFNWRESIAHGKFTNQDIDGGTQGPIEKGFISGDPMSETAGAMSDPTPMINLLAEVSYPIAPGMTELMVSGTAGATVNMNQATKELLDCLRSTSSILCGACLCEEDVDITYGSWSVAQSEGGPQSVMCDYTRVVTYAITKQGQNADCTDCSEVLDTIEQIETRQVLFIGEECPSTPSG